MRDLSFEHVMIQSPGSGTVLNVSSVKQASELLAHCWTKQCGPKHEAAMEICANALKEKASAEEARLAFVEAAKEIDVYVAEKTQTTAPPRSVRNKVNDAAFSENEERPFPRGEN
ncbi:DUF982 domain-containing protein [Phyllobacterium zundukense]|uniref:DUF982 domain-containing protein n=1 Tax=Phyllobacterium zundukense TaxID=1867719 RepID=A0A2N9VTS3_9HYPH|nr:DUF982 domain-containing protein [Phyllobacterium zundukense]ATU93162.1 hypothetical protein BLM14_17260 [Phyllobacterium zundukense]PIO42891.1 hypothetical protein B5P45_20835 [Phyllobacterium zundukense]